MLKPPGKAQIEACRACPLYARATQGVPGEGPRNASMMLVGEQPGDAEDLAGRPFVGPAGQLLRGLMAEAGLDANAVYITNSVKHFSWEPRGKRRIHKTPAQREIAACQQWLDAEIAAVRPRLIVALGAVALRALMPGALTITRARGATLEHPSGARLIATFHPSAALRAPDPSRRDEIVEAIRDDLRRALAEVDLEPAAR
jgi:uracil-DNA glycosylase family protein